MGGMFGGSGSGSGGGINLFGAGGMSFSVSIDMYYTLTAMCMHVRMDMSMFGMSHSQLQAQCSQFYADDLASMCRNGDEPGLESACGNKDYYLVNSVLMGAGLLFIFLKWCIGFARCCTKCCKCNRCVNMCFDGLNVFMSIFGAAVLVVLCIIYGTQCYPQDMVDELERAGFTHGQGYGPAMWCVMAGIVALAGSAVISAIDCCIQESDTPAGPTMTGTPVACSSTSAGDSAGTQMQTNEKV